LLILHAPNFWKWFIGPAVLYFVERILRLRIVNRARYGKTVIEEGITLPSKVIKKLLDSEPGLIDCIYYIDFFNDVFYSRSAALQEFEL
jgi:hypothetical protein